MDGNSDYEIARKARIERNNLELDRLKLRRLPKEPTPELPRTSQKRKRGGPPKTLTLPSRSSKRIRKTKPTYTGETIDNTMDADDQDVQLDLQKKKKKKMTSAQVIAKQKEWLVVHRNEMLSRYSNPTVSPTVHHDTSKWRQIAHDAWGNLVALASKGSKMFDWEEYVLSRTSTPSSCAKSYGLLQEQYQDCPWRLLVACVLMSRVSSESVKLTAINGFLKKYRTPSSVVDVSFDPSEAFEILRPLGLFENRLKAVVEISTAFLMMPSFAVGLKTPLKIYGVGEFGVDSFTIFVRGGAVDLYPNDKNLAKYCRWIRDESK